MADCQIIQEVCKRAGERKAFPAFELTNELARLWLPNQPYAAGTRVRPSKERTEAGKTTGLEYESDGGQSAGREPRRWPSVEGETVDDGSITWTAHSISNASLIHRIESVAYDVPEGITLHEQAFVDDPGAQQVPIEVSGGEVGETYDIVANVQADTVGTSAPLYELVLRVTVE